MSRLVRVRLNMTGEDFPVMARETGTEHWAVIPRIIETTSYITVHSREFQLLHEPSRKRIQWACNYYEFACGYAHLLNEAHDWKHFGPASSGSVFPGDVKRNQIITACWSEANSLEYHETGYWIRWYHETNGAKS